MDLLVTTIRLGTVTPVIAVISDFNWKYAWPINRAVRGMCFPVLCVKLLKSIV